MIKKKLNLLGFNKKMLQEFLVKVKIKKYVAHQIINWIYKYYCFNFFDMTDISLNFREKLNYYFCINLPKVVKIFFSNDGVVKWLIMCGIGYYIEVVYIPQKNRNTVCISTQIGCNMSCSFCETGKQKLKRNLDISEIIGQLLIVSVFLKEKYNKYITNIVIMGMGEPLLNFDNVITSINFILDKDMFNISKRKIVLSTSGIVPAIYKLTNIVDIVLTISLHASNNLLRNKLMPINKIYNIDMLLKSVCYYVAKNKANRGKVNIEYLMIDKVNDSIKEAYELVNLLKNIPSKINLIPFNKVSNSLYKRSYYNNILLFNEILINNHIFSYIRKSRGLDIQASCGQLSGLLIN